MHWTDHELLDHLYGVGPDNRHLEKCAECKARWEALRVHRELVTAAPELSEGRLLAQRRKIWNRIDEGQDKAGWWKPVSGVAMAAAAIVLMVATWNSPAPIDAFDESDVALFAEIARDVDSSTPAALAPLTGTGLSRVNEPGSQYDDEWLMQEIAKDVQSNTPRGTRPIRRLYSEAD